MKGQDADRLAGVLTLCPALSQLDLMKKVLNVVELRGNYNFGAAGAEPEACRSAGAVRSADAPQSLRQSDRHSRGREFCRSADAVPSAGSPYSRRQSDRRCRGREFCMSVDAVRSDDSPQVQWYRNATCRWAVYPPSLCRRHSERVRRGREASSFVAWSSKACKVPVSSRSEMESGAVRGVVDLCDKL